MQRLLTPELEYGATGERSFGVSANGIQELSSFDINKTAGACFRVSPMVTYLRHGSMAHENPAAAMDTRQLHVPQQADQAWQ